MAQLTYSNNPSRAYAGMVADGGFKDIISSINAGPQVYLITVTGATNAATYTVTLNGEDYATVYSDASPTAAELQSAIVVTLADAVTDGLLYSVTEPSSTTILLIAAEGVGVDLEAAIDSDTGDADWSLSQIVGFEASIPFGRFVVGDADRGFGHCRLPNASGDIGNLTLGVALQVTAQEPNNDEGHDHNEVLPVMNKGRCWVQAEETLAAGDNVYIRFQAGAGGSSLGVIRNDADSSSCGQLTRAKVLDYVLIGSEKLALVELS